MADLTYDVQVNVSDATRNLDKLNTKVSNVNKAFSAFRSALAGIAIGSLITSTLRWADAISDLSDATGIAVENIQGFSSAVTASGGNAEGAQKAILQLVQSIGEAADGSAKVQYAFEQVGVSLKDLGSLSEQQILQKTIDGLAKIGDRAKQARLSSELLGKSLRGVELKGLASAYPGAVAEVSASSSAIKAAAGAQQALERNLENLRVALVNVLEPLNTIAAKINITSDAFENLIKFVASAAATYLFFTRAAGPLLAFFAGLGNRMLTIVSGSGLLASAMGLLSRAFYAVVGPIKNWWLAMKQVAQMSGIANKVMLGLAATFSILGRLFVRLLGWVGIIYSVAQAFAFLDKVLNKGRITSWLSAQWDGLISKVKEYYYAAKKALGLGGAPAAPVTSGGPVVTRGGASETKEQAQARMAEADRIREVQDRNEQLRISIVSLGDAYKTQGEQRLAALRVSLQEMSMSENAVEKMQAHNDIYKEASDRVQELIDKKKALKPEEQAVAATIDQQIASILEQAQVNITAADEIITAIQKIRAEQQQLQREYEITGQKARDNLQLDEMSAQLQTIGLYGDALTETNSLLAAEYELKAKLLDIDLRRQQLMLNAAKLGPEALAQELANLAKEEAAARDYADRRVKIDKERLEKEQALRNDSAAGVMQYFEELSRSVDPFVQAQQRASTLFDSMMNAMDDFVRTGKFKFKDFAMSIIRDLIMIELRAKMVALFKTIGMAIFGLAGGGPATAGKPYIVGEQGPELFVPKASGTVVPNGQLMGKGGGGGVGMSAPVTNNYITNNISAIDAKGVAQLFAENRKSLLGTVRYAQKEQSYRVATY